MDIKYSNGNFSFSMTSVDKQSIHNPDEMNTIIEIIKLCQRVAGVEEDASIVKEDIKPEIVPHKKPKKSAIKEERPVARKRLPNLINGEPVEEPNIEVDSSNLNVIDLKKINLTNAKTEKAMLRCPHCGQNDSIIAFTTSVDNVKNPTSDSIEAYFMRQEPSGEYQAIAEFKKFSEINNMSIQKEKTPKNCLEYHEDIKKIKVPSKLRDKDIAVTSNCAIKCPICHEMESYKIWTDCYKDPLLFGFETEELCSICGSEVVSNVTPAGNTIKICDGCGYKSKA